MSAPISHSSLSVSSHPRATRVETGIAPVRGCGLNSPWPERDPELLRHYVAGLGQRAIARAMDLSAGQVSGRLHRYRQLKALPARQLVPRRAFAPLSPDREAARRTHIGARRRQTGAGTSAPAQPATVAPPLPGASDGPATPTGSIVDLAVAHEAAPAAPDTTVPAPSMPPPAPLPQVTRATSCCWPIGEPRTRGFRFCDDQVQPGRPYCPDHAKLAYVPVPAARRAA